MSADALTVVRRWFAALNQGDVEAMAALYADQAELDANEGVLHGRAAIAAAFAAIVRTRAGALDGGARRRLRTLGIIESGIAAEWVSRETVDAAGTLVHATGYDHFVVEHGRIQRQREVVRVTDDDPDAGPARPPSSRQYPERPVVGVGAVIVADNRVVLIKRRFEPLAGQWSLPGGTLEVGETLAAGIAREVLEETGLEVEVGPVLDVFDRILLDSDARVRYHFVLIDYLCRPIGGRLQAGSDVADAVWAAPAELAAYRMTPKTVAIAERGLAQAAAASSSGGGS